MTARVMLEQNKDTTGWGIVGLILGLLSVPMNVWDLLAQAFVIILFPSIGWTVLYFLKREITYRFPPKEPKQLPKKTEEVIQ